jgi:CHAT domain-containing protein
METSADLEQARLLHGRGVAENNAGRPAHATRLFRRAQRLVSGAHDAPIRDRQVLNARLAISQAFSEYELFGLDRGLAALEAAVTPLGDEIEPEIEVHLHLQEGFMRARGGNLAEALPSLDRAAALLDQAGGTAGCYVLMNRGMIHLHLGHLKDARADFQAAVSRARRFELDAELVKAELNLGCLEALAGNLAEALQTMDASLDSNADVSRAVIQLDRAKILIEAGLHREADAALIEAADISRSRRLWHDVGEIELARAECALLNDEVELARRLAGTARDRFRRRANQTWRRQAELVLLQADMAAGRPGSRLSAPARRLVVEFTETGLATQARTAQLIAAEALLQSGRLEDAQAVADQKLISRTDPISVRLYDHYVRAKLAVSSRDRSTARRHVRNGLTELAQYQSSFGSIDLQSGSAVHGRRLAELDVEMALEDGRPAALIEAIERGRATSNRLIPVQSPADEESAILLAELRQTIESIREAEQDPSAADQLPGRRQRVADVQKALRARSWHTDGSRRMEHPARATEIMAGLSAYQASLASYVQVGDSLHVLSAGSSGMRIHGLGSAAEVCEIIRRVRADLDVIANGRLPAALVSAVYGGLRRSLAELDARLIEPLGFSDERVVIVPTGMLAMLPWGSLPSMRGRPVVVAPSGSSWLAAAAPREHRLAQRVTVFAGPGLIRSDEEAIAVGKLWDGAMVSLGDEARRDGLVQAMAEANVVHVAAHGEHQAENPLFSSIRLSDGPVFAYEFDQTARAAEHVVLSACELGLATIRPGDEALGLTSVLLHLGTRSVVAGVARVHDDVAAEVMVNYHSALAKGQDSARALADACAAEVDLPTPFVCFGATWSR